MSTEWITWGLQALIGFLLVVIWQKLEENSRNINALALKLSELYARKDDLESIRLQVRSLEAWKAAAEQVMSILKDRLAHGDKVSRG